MNKKIIRPISQNEIEQFDHDGVILLKDMFDSEWISTLSQGLDKNIDLPSNRSRIWDRDENGRTMFYDAQAWHCLLYTSPSPRDQRGSRMPSSA